MEEGTRRAGSTSNKGSTASTACTIRTTSTAHSTTSYARDGMDPSYTCTWIYPCVWIWYGIRSSPLRGWRFELAGRRVELAGARRRRPKRARGIWGRASRHHEPGHSSDSEEMPAPVHPQVTLDVLNTHMGRLDLQNRQIQGTLNAHIQTAIQWHQ